MINNPFTSKTYELTWLKHFSRHKEGIAFNFVDGLKFYKHLFLPYFINVGRNSTNGITYNLDHNARDYKSKTLLIYDVPSYYKINPPAEDSPIKLYSIKQYKGYLANLESVDNLESYLLKELNTKSRNKFRSALRKFETCFDVEYNIYKDFITKEDYIRTINEFKKIIVRRFETLKLDTNLIAEWPFYTELIYKMILDEKAILVSIKANGKPVSMSLAFLGSVSLVGAIKAFDSDFYKFNVGHIEISKLIEFCLQNNLKYFDFSKGTYKYKDRWTNSEYNYNCHILYDSSSFTSSMTARLLARFFNFKQYLRDKNFNLLLVKVKYKLKHIILSTKNKQRFVLKPIKKLENIDSLLQVNLEEESIKYPFLNRIVYDGLFKNPEPFKNLKVYKSRGSKLAYYVVGKASLYSIEII
ncbi:GNAT family N-acetyltransferase [Hanstruepera marina]|uniref:GNAT family N-acetyltransferase n=1 Tax=Hanstruepera marina TaxID=2873265 RepID=UPI001CA63298|nr:GNAT family N-acetyltransferase [Hanstruepera marina]